LTLCRPDQTRRVQLIAEELRRLLFDDQDV
jgi:hypothetical protein